MRVLVVEDHPKLAMAVATGLRRAGLAVDVAFDGHDALAHAQGTGYDVVVLDRDIPGCTATRCAVPWWRTAATPGC